jgi:hypothetical protein
LSPSSYSFTLKEGHDVRDPPAFYKELVSLAEQVDQIHIHPGESDEDPGVAAISSFLRNLTNPLSDWECLQNPIIDRETRSSLSCLPHTNYSFASPYILPNL